MKNSLVLWVKLWVGRQDLRAAGSPATVTADGPRNPEAAMRRREFITLIGGAAAWPLTARAQQAGKLPTIGFLGGATATAWSNWSAAFVQRLRELGWSEGRTVAIEYRWAEGRHERAAEIAAEFVRLKVDVILTSGGVLLAAKQATSTIPIVFAVANDPVGAGFVSSLARPGGNITGLSLQTTDLAASGLNSCAKSSPVSVVWGSWPISATQQPSLRLTRFRQQLAFSASRLPYSRCGGLRISPPPSRHSKVARKQFMSAPTHLSSHNGLA
jgi:hypothetical protein